jgi:hypothetical protein
MQYTDLDGSWSPGHRDSKLRTFNTVAKLAWSVLRMRWPTEFKGVANCYALHLSIICWWSQSKHSKRLAWYSDC